MKKDQILLSRFCLREMIGQGGMGQVWLVWDLELEIQVAVKILNSQIASDPDRIKLLKNECRNTRGLVHPNIVRVFDFHRFEDLAFISMEYINGRNLTSYRDEIERIRPDDFIRLLKPVINALGYAHEQGLIHRDVKAGNILIDRQETPRLTDFGIAGAFKSGRQALEITSGGSLFCMSPQQLDGRPAGPSDDIYALGVLLYELFTGYPPFYPDITRDKILSEIPAPVNQRLDQMGADVNIPAPLEKLVARMLAKIPDERPASMQQIDEHLERILSPRIDQTVPSDGFDPAVADQKTAPSYPAELITPIRVASKTAKRELPFNERSNRVKGITLAVAFVFLLTGGFWLWHYLASRPFEPSPAQKPVAEPDQQLQNKAAEIPAGLPEQAPDPVALAAEKKQAEQQLAEFMQLKQTLEAKGVSQWAGAAYGEMVQLAEAADRFLIENDFIAAGEKYAAAASKARILVDQVELTLKRLLAEGRTALDEQNGQLARQKFSIALAIDPENESARHNLQRARKIDAVRQLLESGSRHEKAGKIAFAHADYQEALRLDPESKEAREALGRIKGQIRDEEFRQLMSEGLTALHLNDYQLARAKLLKARSFRPESREVKDALAQVDQAIQLAQIEAYRQNALKAEKSENWERALNTYLQVLKIDSSVQFAAQGKQRALKYIQIDKRINFFLQQPTALQSDRQLENAIQLITEIEELDLKGPQLKSRFEKLRQIVDAAQTPVKIILESDSFTEVIVYKVGKLGRFMTRELNLRPGSYTVVGTREGYQDVRKKITIKPGQAPAHVLITCEVKI